MIALSSARQLHIAALDRDLASVVTQLRAVPAVQRVILFGSYAAGRRDLFTDLDILVVIESTLDFVSRAADLAQQLHIEGPVDLLVYTPQEMARIRDRPFIRHALATGKVLYERKSAD